MGLQLGVFAGVYPRSSISKELELPWEPVAPFANLAHFCAAQRLAFARGIFARDFCQVHILRAWLLLFRELLPQCPSPYVACTQELYLDLKDTRGAARPGSPPAEAKRASLPPGRLEPTEDPRYLQDRAHRGCRVTSPTLPCHTRAWS